MARKSAKKLTQDEYFVRLFHGFLDEPAWLGLPCTARMLYITIKRHFNGSNNGNILLSYRQAARETGMSRSTVERNLRLLIEKGFLKEGRKGFLGSDGMGQASTWTLTELGLYGERPTKDYRR